ncbi:MAG: YggS family pyridoxal phosphate-dependent enzyme, partial [Proteobacteria bacterium]|nr:YggS family pyridoxal phosphate-dependent enzyme [Pseudomonadota bacterium]
PVRWHFIGGLQRNKVKYIIGKVFLIHSLDSISLAEEIDKRARNAGVIQNVLVQINQGEDTKGGVPLSSAEDLIKNLNKFRNINLLGLMSMPPFLEDVGRLRSYFKEVRELRDYLNSRSCYKEPLRELSMGMSSDFEIAIEEGSTMVRVGTALLGERIKKVEVL